MMPEYLMNCDVKLQETGVYKVVCGIEQVGDPLLIFIAVLLLFIGLVSSYFLILSIRSNYVRSSRNSEAFPLMRQ